MLTRRVFVGTVLGAALVGGVFGSRPLVAAEVGQSGTVTGLLSARGNNWIEVKTDGAEKATRYTPRWIGGMPRDGGGLDKGMIQVIAGVKTGDKVKLEWAYEERMRVVGLSKVE